MSAKIYKFPVQKALNKPPVLPFKRISELLGKYRGLAPKTPGK